MISRRIKFGFLLAFVAVLVAVGAFWYLASALSAPVNHAVSSAPTDLAVKTIQFPSASGSTIHGWFISRQPRKGIIVLLHGIRSDRSSMVNRARFLSRAGYSVLLVDFQAHGESAGDHITFGYLESRDAQAAIRFAREQLPGEKIGVIGVSMGGAAILLAEPPLNVDAVVLEMVYPTIEDAIADRLKIRLGPWGGWLSPALSLQLKPRLGVSANELRPIDRLAGMATPKLFIVGELDQHTTLNESEKMYEQASAPKEMWVVPMAAHIDLHAYAQQEYERRVLAFFERNLTSSQLRANR